MNNAVTAVVVTSIVTNVAASVVTSGVATSGGAAASASTATSSSTPTLITRVAPLHIKCLSGYMMMLILPRARARTHTISPSHTRSIGSRLE